MALEQKLQLKLQQKLMLTPQLQQAIKLLQYQKLELQEVITQEMVENPVLEEQQEVEEFASPAEREASEAEAKKAADDKEPEVAHKDSIDEFDYQSYFQDYLDYGSPQPARSAEVPTDFPTTENTLAQSVSLAEHLLWQLNEVTASERIREIASAIVGNLNHDGYLVATIEEIQGMGPYDEEETLTALHTVQHLDPVGVAARDLCECLLVQLRHLNLGDTAAETIVREHLPLLHRRKIDEIAKRLKLEPDEVLRHVEVIRHLDPKPGSKYSEAGAHYVTPDVYVRKVDGEYQIILNEEGMPRLRISSVYRRLLANKDSLAAETRQFVNEKFKSALWLIRSLDQRQRTIYKVSESIVKYQREFLDKGIHYLRPLVLRDVAQDIEMHESTVSRVVTNKYMHTPQGLLEMKYFFHSGIQTETGSDVSSLSVKQKIKKYVDEEDSSRPLSDSRLVKLLKAEGLEIARRTVAKYRDELGIQSSPYRRHSYS